MHAGLIKPTNNKSTTYLEKRVETIKHPTEWVFWDVTEPGRTLDILSPYNNNNNNNNNNINPLIRTKLPHLFYSVFTLVLWIKSTSLLNVKQKKENKQQQQQQQHQQQ